MQLIRGRPANEIPSAGLSAKTRLYEDSNGWFYRSV